MRFGLFLTSQQRLNVDMVAAFGEHVAMVHHARDAAGDSRGALRARPFDELLSGRFGPRDVLLAEDLSGQGHVSRTAEAPHRSIAVPLAEDTDLGALLAGLRGG